MALQPLSEGGSGIRSKGGGRSYKKVQYTATHCNALPYTLSYTPVEYQAAAWPSGRCLRGGTETGRDATYYKTLQHAATHCDTLQHAATRCNTLQHAATHSSRIVGHCMALQPLSMGGHGDRSRRRKELKEGATHCNALRRAATRCDALQRTATHCNALQRTATHCNRLI